MATTPTSETNMSTTKAAKTTGKAKAGKVSKGAAAGSKPRKAKGEAAPAAEKKGSALTAAARVLTEAGTAMTCQELIGVMAAKGYWTSPGGKTPHATLYSAILREITVKGDASRFQKAAPGRFAAAGIQGQPTLAPGAAKGRKSSGRKPATPAPSPGPEASPEPVTG